MNKDQYVYFKTKIKDKIADLNLELQQAEKDYIRLNKPCNVGDHIELTHGSGRKEKMKVVAFTVLNDEVYVSRFKAIVEGKVTMQIRFITNGHGAIKIINSEFEQLNPEP